MARVHPLRSILVLATLLAPLALAGCTAGGDTEAVLAQAMAKAKPSWKLQLDEPGAAVDLPLTEMNILLAEEEDEYPEVFEILGPDVALVGTFPMDLHVGYDESFDQLVGRTIAIDPSGGDPRDPKSSYVRLNGVPAPVSGGSFTIERVTGKFAGSHGDRTVWGTVTLRLFGADGERTVSGKLAVHAITWG